MKPMWPAWTFSPEQQRRMLLLAIGLLGLGVSVWLFGPDARVLEALDEEVTQLHARLQAAPGHALSDGKVVQTLRPMPDAPGLSETPTVWPWMQQRLRAQGLQVQTLQPLAITTVRGLPEQAVLLRLQGRWRDWLAFEQAAGEEVPWWVIDHWQMVPVGKEPAEVRIELQVRLGLLPAVVHEKRAAPRVWPVWDVDSGLADVGAPLFDGPATPSAVGLLQTRASEGDSALLPDPARWPVRALRLLGVWHQSGADHAVLGSGLDKVTVRPGQQVGIEGYRVRKVSEAGVELQAPDPSGPVLRLILQGDKP